MYEYKIDDVKGDLASAANHMNTVAAKIGWQLVHLEITDDGSLLLMKRRSPDAPKRKAGKVGCRDCHGSGGKKASPCQVCNGTGFIDSGKPSGFPLKVSALLGSGPTKGEVDDHL